MELSRGDGKHEGQDQKADKKGLGADHELEKNGDFGHVQQRHIHFSNACDHRTSRIPQASLISRRFIGPLATALSNDWVKC
ncbi:hypothetical protein MRX96_050422 [Rhipicephalus microplus]